jgi:hypothetical protein
MARSKMGRRGSVESPAAVPVQTVRYRAPPGCRPRRRAGWHASARGAAGPAAGDTGRRRWGALA